MLFSNSPGERKIGRDKVTNTDIKFPKGNKITLFSTKVLHWFSDHKRRFAWREPSTDRYMKIVAEVLLQRTRAETVSAFLPQFLQLYPDWESLAQADETVLSEVLKPLGLWRRRTTSLLGLARGIVEREGIWPLDRQDLESIPAVGQYVANAVLLFEHSSNAPLLDASMARLLRRYFDLSPVKADIRYDKLLQTVAYKVLRQGNPISLNWGMLDLAAVHCKPSTPKCDTCPLRSTCQFARSSRRSPNEA